MANFKTRAMNDEEYSMIVKTLAEGFIKVNGSRFYPKPQAAMAIVLIANLGLRIGDACCLRLTDISNERGRYVMRIKEQKTGKTREQTVQVELYSYI